MTLMSGVKNEMTIAITEAAIKTGTEKTRVIAMVLIFSP
ncbi:hypothetical protein SDC9_116091 [bioreactor metagenome]|uniref:Uncharacterized protein n=1 Tax=bioreactor metagenome TaxID=1076179 RepID=A0A645BVB9_9ZZZZ